MCRAAYLDNLKLVMTVLVIVHHLAITYGANGSWYYVERPVEPATSFALSIFTSVNQSFFMGLFFFISGAFTPASCDRKGVPRFVGDRLLRLGLPLALFGLTVSPALEYLKELGNGGAVGSYGDFLRDCLAHPFFAPGPLWFVETLLALSIVYALLHRLVPRTAAPEAPTVVGLVALSLGIGALQFLVRIAWPLGTEWHHLQLGFFPQYVVLFSTGVVAARRGWLEALPDRLLRATVPLGVGAFAGQVALVGLFGGAEATRAVAMGGARWQSLAWSTLESAQCVGIATSLVLIFRRWFGEQGRLARAMTEDAYAVYVIHAPVAVLVALAARGYAAHPLAKLLVTSLATVSLCFLASHALRRLPAVRRVL